MAPQDGDTIVVWFSNGAASAVAAYLTLQKYGHRCNVLLVNNPVIEEDEDNQRFQREVSDWLEKPIILYSNTRFQHGSAVRVWDERGAMSFPRGAPCTYHLKKEARQQFERELVVHWHVLGFTSDERGRYDRFVLSERANTLPILIDEQMSKAACAAMLQMHGIQLPRMYSLGFPNANCRGCVKATSPTYWNLTRRVYPDTFEARAEQSRRLGAKLVRHKGKRLFLDELPADATGRPLKTMDIECGIFCEEKFAVRASKRAPAMSLLEVLINNLVTLG